MMIRCYKCGLIRCETCGGHGTILLMSGNAECVDDVDLCPDCKDGWREAERYRFKRESRGYCPSPPRQTGLGPSYIAYEVHEGTILCTDPAILCPKCEKEVTR